ncbi:BA14K family protein [Rhizobiaceae bacterium BDR2-2]|uniref:Lectin-like protein BA14k n=1 Tax=Ectorhizobium quercum TaxID=2965071 RepID=A0AAE3N0B2_9HYPH|nr:BA14K family protein [Ectorhizobium quercum]MCX8998254.1 BA14K family protein [Ectorhizobium quercum]
MTRIGRFLAVCMLGFGAIAGAMPAFSMPAAPALPAVAAGDITLAQWGPPPRWDQRRPPPGWGHRPPPPPPHWGHRPPPPPPGWRHRPPPRHHYRPAPPPRVYHPRPHARSHVQWCLNRYRSYNPATNRFLSNSGHYRICVSPYSR